jgi:outer membrane protein assembly factor BamB
MWGFSASPLVKDGLVTVFGGAEGKAVVAYDAATGDLRWSGGDGLMSYASTHLASIDGVEQLLMATNDGLYSFDPASGKELWKHEWTSGDAARIVQPAIVEGNDVILGTGMGIGTRRIHVVRDGDAWTTQEVWTTKQFKPYFNDFVVYEGALYGFDGAIFSCVDAETGDVNWKERGYGSGQVLLLADQGLLLVLAETGEVALLEANAEELRELAKIPALAGKTWNHPVVAHGLLLVRNGEEMVCFELPVEETSTVSVSSEANEP